MAAGGATYRSAQASGLLTPFPGGRDRLLEARARL